MDRQDETKLNLSLLKELLSGLDKKKWEYCQNILDDENVQNFLKDKELTETVEHFLDSNLNISKASKQTFMHRNTLLYRIEKVKKFLGLDARNFEDAVTLKIILVLSKLSKN